MSLLPRLSITSTSRLPLFLSRHAQQPLRLPRFIHSSGALGALKESRDKEGIEHDIEHHKQDQLRKKDRNENHWTEELASESESAVKADRDHLSSGKDGVEDLQKKTVDTLHKGGKIGAS